MSLVRGRFNIIRLHVLFNQPIRRKTRDLSDPRAGERVEHGLEHVGETHVCGSSSRTTANVGIVRLSMAIDSSKFNRTQRTEDQPKHLFDVTPFGNAVYPLGIRGTTEDVS